MDFLCYCVCINALRARRSCMPAVEWMVLSMQLCKGIKQPNSALLAALTMASTFNRVMSPRHKCSPSPLISTTPLSKRYCWSSASCARSNSFEGWRDSLTFINARNNSCFSGKVKGKGDCSPASCNSICKASSIFSIHLIYLFVVNRSPTKPLVSVPSSRLKCRRIGGVGWRL